MEYDITLLNSLFNLFMVVLMGGFVRYHMGKLKEIEKILTQLMSREEIRLYVRDQISDKFRHIEYVLAELKQDIQEIKESLRKEKPR